MRSGSLLRDKLAGDNEFKFYIIRVNRLYKAETLRSFGISRSDYLDIITQTLSNKNDIEVGSMPSIFTPCGGEAHGARIEFDSSPLNRTGQPRGSTLSDNSQSLCDSVSSHLSKRRTQRGMITPKSAGHARYSLEAGNTPDHASGYKERGSRPLTDGDEEHLEDVSGSSDEVSIHYRQNIGRRSANKAEAAGEMSWKGARNHLKKASENGTNALSSSSSVSHDSRHNANQDRVPTKGNHYRAGFIPQHRIRKSGDSEPHPGHNYHQRRYPARRSK